MLQRFLDPKVLSSISGLELVAKTVVDGFVSGLHRSPDFGFSQEFEEYRAYVEGDDLRHVDWNVFARTERAYLKKFRGETNVQLTLLLDASASMGYGSAGITKLDYARYLAASLAYLSNQQRDASGVVVFDDDIRAYIPPSGRHGQLLRVLHVIEKATPGKRTEFAGPFIKCTEFLFRRGIVAVFSDFYEQPDVVVKAVEPLRFRGHEVVLFHVMDPQELRPRLDQSTLLVDLESDDTIEVTPEYVRDEYGPKMDAHLAAMKSAVQRGGMDYVLLDTGKPLDGPLREYLTIRQGRH